jgi:hypothetical protein
MAPETMSAIHHLLPRHLSPCDDCKGTGREVDEDDDSHCPECDGRGSYPWWWQHDETESCTSCGDGSERVPLCCWNDDHDEYLCVRCVVARHARMCGCALWPHPAPKATPAAAEALGAKEAGR